MFINNLNIYKIIFIIELLVAEFLFSFRFQKRDNYILRMILTTIACVTLAVLFPIFYYNSTYSTVLFLCLFAITIVAMLICYKESILHIVYSAVAAYTVRHIAFQIFSLIMTLIEGTNSAVNGIYGNSSLQELTFNGSFFLSILIYLDCYYSVYVLAYFLFGRKLNFSKTTGLKKVYLLFLVAIILIIDIILNSIFVYNETQDDMLNTIVLYIYNILCCCFAVFIQFSMLDMRKLQNELEIVNTLWKQEREQYEISKENIELINLKCHDLKYQIRNIGKMKEIDSKAIKEMENIISIYDSTVKTNNEEIDIILTEKSLVCCKNNIKLTVMLDGTQLKFIDKTDVYILFGNLIDNAIEAVMRLEDVDRRIITINGCVKNHVMALNVSNYYKDIVFDHSGLPKTTKTDKNFHGYGLKSICMIVEKYKGDVNITAKDSIFNIDIIMPIPSR